MCLWSTDAPSNEVKILKIFKSHILIPPDSPHVIDASQVWATLRDNVTVS